MKVIQIFEFTNTFGYTVRNTKSAKACRSYNFLKMALHN